MFLCNCFCLLIKKIILALKIITGLCRRNIQRSCRKCILYCPWSIETTLWSRGWYLERWSDTVHPSLWCHSFFCRFLFSKINELDSLQWYFSTITWIYIFTYAETEEGIFDAILHGHIDFTSDPWPSISTSAKELVKMMLRPDPKERLTAAEILSKI